MTSATSAPGNLGALLIARGVLDAGGLARIEEIRARSPQRLSGLIVDMGLLSSDALYDIFADITGLQLWDGEGDPFIDEGFPPGFIDYNRFLPVLRTDGPCRKNSKRRWRPSSARTTTKPPKRAASAPKTSAISRISHSKPRSSAR